MVSIEWPGDERWFRHLWLVCSQSIFPLKESDWKEETAKNKKSLIQTNLLDDLGEIPLVNFDRFTLQLHIDKLAKAAREIRCSR